MNPHPSSPTAERGFLAEMINDPTQIADFGYIKPEYFDTSFHERIWSALTTLSAKGEHISLLTLSDRLASPEDIAELPMVAGYTEYLGELPTATSCAAIILRCALQRKHAKLAEQYTNMACMADPAKTAQIMLKDLLALMELDQAQRVVKPIHEVIGSYLERIEERVNFPDRVLRTGFEDLDRAIGGIDPGSLVILAGRPRMGKSALGEGIGYRAAKRFKAQGIGSVLYVTLEMPPEDVVERLVANQGKPALDTTYLRAGMPGDDGQPDAETYSDLYRYAALVDDATSGHLFLTSGASVATDQLFALVQQTPNLRLLIVDYLDLLQEQGDEYVRLSTASWKLKQLAMRCGIGVLCLVQVSRNVENRDNKRPTLADLRGTGRLEQDADLILGLYRPEEYYPCPAHTAHPAYPYFAELSIMKHRKGRAGGGIVPLFWIPEAAQYDDFPHHTYDLALLRQCVAAKETEK